MNINCSLDPTFFSLKGKMVRLFQSSAKELIILKNSSFDLPANIVMDNSELDLIFRQLLKDNYITIAPPIRNRSKVLVTRDILCTRAFPLSSLTSLFLNEDVESYDSLWLNSNNVSLLNTVSI